MTVVVDDLITHNDAYLDSGDIVRQLGLLPPAGSSRGGPAGDARQRQDAAGERRAGERVEPIAEASGSPRRLPDEDHERLSLADGGGVTVFDAGIAACPGR